MTRVKLLPGSYHYYVGADFSLVGTAQTVIKRIDPRAWVGQAKAFGFSGCKSPIAAEPARDEWLRTVIRTLG
jgi:hypothetical protein